MDTRPVIPAKAGTQAGPKAPFDVGVAMPTVVRPTLAEALRSIYAQRFDGRIHVVLGVDRWEGARALVDALLRECPSHVAVTLLDLGYSTSARHGGVYPSRFGGALKTIMSFAVNSRHVAYLDDDNTLAPDHFATLRAAVDGKAWAFALRNFCDSRSGDRLCVDTWESVGPGRGVYAGMHGGFVDANCYLMDAHACYDAFPEWAMTRHPDGTGGDRQVFEKLRNRSWGTSGIASVNYSVRLDEQPPVQLLMMQRAGVDLARYVAPERMPREEEILAGVRAQPARRTPA